MVADVVDEAGRLLERARATPVSRPGIEALSGVLGDDLDVVRSAVGRAVEGFEGAAGALLVMAATADGTPLDPDDIWPLLGMLPDIHWVPLLVGAAGPGKMQVLIKALASGQLSNEREGICVLLATEIADAGGVPPLVLSKIRMLAQKSLTHGAGVSVGLAASAVDDPATRRDAAKWLALANLASGRGMLSGVRALLKGEFPEVIPTRHEGRRVGEPPVRREAERVGRNDPCPCGSGQKYKRCCANKPSASAPVAAAAPVASELDRPKAAQVIDLSAFELARLQFSSLDTRSLIAAVIRLGDYRFWDKAEEAMEVLAGRGDIPMQASPDGFREGLIQEAIRAKAVEVVRRQLAKIQNPYVLEELKLELSFLEPNLETLRTVEEAAFHAISDDEWSEWHVAFTLLEHSPALGILVARGVLDPGRPSESEKLLAAVEEARIRLELPAGDLATFLYEAMLGREEEAAGGAPIGPQVSELKVQLKEKAGQVTKLADKLARLEAERLASPRPNDVPEPDRADLRQKIGEMKSLIAEGQKERAELRRKLAEAGRSSPEAPPAREAAAEDPAEEDAGESVWEKVLVPGFSSRAAAALATQTPALAGRAVRLAAELASGDPAAWTGVKRLKGRSDIWSARVGIHHRLLFRLEAARSQLEVVAFIQRRDLDATLKQLV